MRDLCYLTTTSAEIHVALRLTGRGLWGTASTGRSYELWAGRLYVCASIPQPRARSYKTHRRIAAALALAFAAGWLVPSPLSASHDPVEVAEADLAVNREHSPRH